MPDATIADRYRIGREIGRGGMAVVYRAEDLRYHRQVAVKLLHPELAAVIGGARFLREIAIAAQLTHPHVVPVFDSGEWESRLFFVMPYLGGETLRHRLQREGRLPVDDAIAIARQVAAALAYAHARGVVHRDVKPENVLLHEGEAMVADFGVAFTHEPVEGGRLTGTGLIVGTPAYMSPEQAFGEAVDARSDQYALACVLYEMLAGEPPWVGASAQVVITRRLVDPVPSARGLRPEVPVAVDAALARAMSREVGDRFAAISDFAAALDVAARVVATPPPALRLVAPDAASVAVLPFRTLVADAEDQCFADGITEDVIAHLSKIRAMRVTSRNSVMRYRGRELGTREIGTQLGVAALLDGSIRRAGGRVRVVAQLVDATSDRQLWAETYDRQLTDIFAIQTDVALHIAEALQAELTRDEQARVCREPTRDVQAYQLYVQGRHLFIQFTPERLQSAIGWFERAIARDPGFALAYANLAWAYIELAEMGVTAPEEVWQRARDAVAQALRLDPELSAGHSAAGYLKTVRDYDWAGAERDFLRAIELSPSDADAYDGYGRLCASVGRYDDAVTLSRRAQELDPLTHQVDVATSLLRAGRFEEAARSAERLVAQQPEHSRALATLGWAYLLGGRPDEGVDRIARAVRTDPSNPMWVAQLGEAYGMIGERERARAMLRELQERATREFVSPYHLAYVYTGLGDFDAAIDLLERAVAERTGATYGIKGSFLFTPLHDHPRFRALLRTLNLS